MSDFAFLRRTLGAGFLAACAAFAFAPAVAQKGPGKDPIPDFTAPGTGWTMINSNATDYVDPQSGPKPVTNDPKYPHVGNLQPGQKTERVADLTNPILQDWVKPQMRKYNQEVIDGTIPFVATSLCYPGGVPAQLLVPTTMYFIQKPDEVIMIWERDQLVRHVYLDTQHTKNPRPTWFGESVGHYENGDSLVIDTVGLAAKPFSYVDNYRTPHTDKLHVVERWTLSKDAKAIEVSFTADDPGTFDHPWGGRVRYRKVARGPLLESVCAENNTDYFGLDQYPMPEAKAADF